MICADHALIIFIMIICVISVPQWNFFKNKKPVHRSEQAFSTHMKFTLR
jgi:hypothetical protein